ncbi:MAG: acyl-CoA dehydrogenase family protein [Actinomycetota bacterium]
MDLSIPVELRDVQSLVRSFIARELAPLEREVEESDDMDHAVAAGLRQKAVDLGFYGFNISAEVGGVGIGPLGEVLIGEEAGRTSIPLAEVLGRLPNSLSLCRPDQYEWLLGPALRGEKTACVALTEPDAGSDLGGIRTQAVRDGDTWVLNGSKQFISQAETSDYILVLAVTDSSAPLKGRFTVFAVARDNPGLHFTRREKKMGWRGYHISDFVLEDARVDANAVIGEVNGGFAAMMASVNTQRLFIAARCVGTAEELLKLAIRHANTRTTFGKLLGEHQNTQMKLADIDVEIEAARLLVRSGAWKIEQGDPDARIAASRAKLYATEMAGRTADAVMQIFGGMGYMTDLPIERMYRDMRGYRIGEGTSEMQRIQIARSVLARA